MISLIGNRKSRALRVLWALEELLLEYKLVEANNKEEIQQSLADQWRPNHIRVPVLLDKNLVLDESVAIILYLFSEYGPGEGGDSVNSKFGILRWCLWAQSHLEPWLQTDKQTKFVHENCRGELDVLLYRELNILDQQLSFHSNILSDDFTAADLVVCSILSQSRISILNLKKYSKLTDWMERCRARPAYARSRIHTK